MIKVSQLNNAARNGEVNTLAQAILANSYRIVLDNDNYLSQLLEELQAEQTALNEAILENRTKSDLNSLLAEIKSAYRIFYRLVLAYAELPSDAASAPARMLLTVFDRHHQTITYRNNQGDVNSAITSLLAELQTDEMMAYVLTNAHFQDALALLSVAQVSFIDMYTSYKNERKLELERETAGAIKTRIRMLINERLVLHLNAMQYVDSVQYTDFATAVTAYIEQTNLTVKVRLGQASAEELAEVETA